MIVSIQTGPSESKVVRVDQKEIAEELQVSVSYVSKCLLGHRVIKRRQAARVEKKFGIPTTIWPRIAA